MLSDIVLNVVFINTSDTFYKYPNLITELKTNASSFFKYKVICFSLINNYKQYCYTSLTCLILGPPINMNGIMLWKYIYMWSSKTNILLNTVEDGLEKRVSTFQLEITVPLLHYNCRNRRSIIACTNCTIYCIDILNYYILRKIHWLMIFVNNYLAFIYSGTKPMW